ncbi:MAG: hypothetical protein VB144_03420 [Clostridia bacterium]|nr:hypothetical protein [Clostridia bacterium]
MPSLPPGDEPEASILINPSLPGGGSRPGEPDGTGDPVSPKALGDPPPPEPVRTATRYIVAHGKHLAKVVQEGDSPAQTYFLHTDMLGSIRVVTDSAGQVVARFDYEPFGLVIEESGPATSGAERYAGKPLDAALELTFRM